VKQVVGRGRLPTERASLIPGRTLTRPPASPGSLPVPERSARTHPVPLLRDPGCPGRKSPVRTGVGRGKHGSHAEGMGIANSERSLDVVADAFTKWDALWGLPCLEGGCREHRAGSEGVGVVPPEGASVRVNIDNAQRAHERAKTDLDRAKTDGQRRHPHPLTLPRGVGPRRRSCPGKAKNAPSCQRLEAWRERVRQQGSAPAPPFVRPLPALPTAQAGQRALRMRSGHGRRLVGRVSLEKTPRPLIGAPRIRRRESAGCRSAPSWWVSPGRRSNATSLPLVTTCSGVPTVRSRPEYVGCHGPRPGVGPAGPIESWTTTRSGSISSK
jgi:hypothetical protein